MTVTVFNGFAPKNKACYEDDDKVMTPEHVKPTFTEVARKLRVIRVRIQRVRQNLRDIDIMLDEVHDAIHDLEEIDNSLRRRCA